LDDAENNSDRSGIEFLKAVFSKAVDPIEDVETSIRTEGEEVKGVDNGGNSSLAEKEELWENADGFKDYRERPREL
jgi:hypothetical protein